ncbi:MAG: cytochrome-c oxidase, cbb3-type subunit II [Gammaproteobacteria bacterium]|nr:cytochrome-c oxidase, cbb3-type subunit II [Gammaproteobacteria bacterium]NIR58769.1 cytochrome-c oxidase, cbb3-type subunit II [Gammaproteobacteria bacterium]NIV73801.1 cytochrome-c oxidase, cbb3-type subunit II [Gammaproteobacteria bacterium]
MASHEIVEKNTGLLAILILLVVSIGGLVEIIPLMFMKSTTEPVEGVGPYSALRLAGRDVYVREGCYVCHSQMIRPFRAETERYGHYSVAGEFVYDHPFQWGSKRTGPDLARVGGRYSDEWHRVHLMNPRDVVPESNMPGFPWLAENRLDGSQIQERMRVMNTLIELTCSKCETYSADQIADAPEAVEGKAEIDALIAYLQGLGTAISSRR